MPKKETLATSNNGNNYIKSNIIHYIQNDYHIEALKFSVINPQHWYKNKDILRSNMRFLCLEAHRTDCDLTSTAKKLFVYMNLKKKITDQISKYYPNLLTKLVKTINSILTRF